MDFCIADNIDELERENFFSDISFFSRNLVTFINFVAFEEKYLNLYEHNYFRFLSSNVFNLQANENIGFLSFSVSSESKLR